MAPALVIDPSDPCGWPYPGIDPVRFFATRDTAVFGWLAVHGHTLGHPLASSFNYWFHLWWVHASPPSVRQAYAERLRRVSDYKRTATSHYPATELERLTVEPLIGTCGLPTQSVAAPAPSGTNVVAAEPDGARQQARPRQRRRCFLAT